MRAIVTKAFPGCPDDEIETRTIAAGETIEGDLAAVAVREGWANEVSSDGGEASDGLDDEKKASLIKIAAAEGVALEPKAEKDDIIAAIRAARAAKSA